MPMIQRPPTALDAILNPRSVAVIGASRDPDSISGRLFRNVLETFRGPVYAVNPRTAAIGNVPAYASLLDVPGAVDLAVVAVPAAAVLTVVNQCAEKGVRGLVVISAGFSETGKRGEQLALLAVVRAAGMRMVGPNCVGVVNTAAGAALNATFAPFSVPGGNVAVCTQSGALGVVIPQYVRRWQIGLSSLVSVGNKADLGENEFLEFAAADPASEVLVLYLESFQDPRKLLSLARDVGRRKPIVLLKAGGTQSGARAAGSHTAALASPRAAADALFRQSGMIQVATLEELFDVTALLSCQPVPRGRRVAVLTNAGGPGVLCADALESGGLLLPELSAGLQNSLRQFLRPETTVQNPVDLIGSIDAQEFGRCLQLLLRSDEVDSVIVVYVPRTTGSTAAIVRAVYETAAVEQGRKTLAGVFVQTEATEVPPSATRTIPSYAFPERAAKALARATQYGRRREQPEGRIRTFADVSAARARRVAEQARLRLGRQGGWLEAGENNGLLAACGIAVPAWETATTADEAAAAARRLGGRVVVKVIAPSLLHKSERGGVVLDVHGDEAVRDAFAQVTAAAGDARSALVQQFIAPGHEMLIGVTRDAAFGHLIALGWGGVLVELAEQPVFRLLPLLDCDAADMLHELHGSRLLAGYRGRPPADVAALTETLLRISQLISTLPDIAELDLNPVKVLAAGNGVKVVDCRLRLAAE